MPNESANVEPHGDHAPAVDEGVAKFRQMQDAVEAHRDLGIYSIDTRDPAKPVWVCNLPRVVRNLAAANALQGTIGAHADDPATKRELMNAAAIGLRVSRAARTVKNWFQKAALEPDIVGRGGAESVWDWQRAKPVCERALKTQLP